MDLRTNTGRAPSVLERYTSFSQLQPNHELLSPRFFAGTPGPNEYNIKSSIGNFPGTTMKGNRRRNFDRAKQDCSFLLPELIDRFPAPNTYRTDKSTICQSPGVSFKGKRGGPFQSNKGQMYIRPQYNERDKMSETYDTTSYIGKSSGVSFKGNRRRQIVMEPKNANTGFLLPNLIEVTPGPGSYNIGSSIGKGTSVSFKGRKTGPFQTTRGATYIGPELNDKDTRPGHYALASPNSSGVSFKGNRQRTFENAKQSNAVFLLPNEIDETPGPGFYSSKTSIGSSTSVSMKGRKSGPFQTNKGQAHIPVEVNSRDNNPAPNEYDFYSRRSSNSGVSMKGDRRHNVFTDKLSEGDPGPGAYEVDSPRSSHAVKFKGRRLGPFQTTSGAMYIKPEYDVKSKTPSVGSYNISKQTGKDAPSATFKGSRPKSLFGGNVFPLSVAITTTNA